MPGREFFAYILRHVKEESIGIVPEAFIDIADLFAIGVVKMDGNGFHRVAIGIKIAQNLAPFYC